MGSIRQDLLDHVLVINEEHLRRLLKEYLDYYHFDRIHLGLEKNSPRGRPPEARLGEDSTVKALPRCGGLHHRYTWRQAAKAPERRTRAMICLAGASSAYKGFPTHFFIVKDMMTIWMANRDA